MKQKNNINAIVFIFVSMIFVAIAENLKGVLIPVFKKEFMISNTSISLMLTIGSIAYIVFTYTGGILCEKIGQKWVFTAGFSILILSMIGAAFSQNYILFLIMIFFMNGATSFIDIAINTVVPILFLSYQAILMNLTHFFYGLGTTGAQRAAGLLLYRGISWRTIYFGAALLTVGIFIIHFFIKIPEVHSTEDRVKLNTAKLLRNKLLYLYILGLGFYVAAEVGTANWFVNFLEQYYHFNKSISSYYLSLFFGIFTFGRLIGGFLVEKIGAFKAVIGSLIIAAVMYTAGIILGIKGLYLISLSGLFFAITFPTVVVTISKVFTEKSSYITGLIITLVSLISLIANLIIGVLNDKIGVYLTFYIFPVFIVLAVIFFIILSREIKLSEETRRSAV